MMMKERHSYIIRTALMAASGILLCGIAEAVRPEALNCQDTESDEENGTPDSHGIPVFKWSGGRLGRICSVGNGV